MNFGERGRSPPENNDLSWWEYIHLLQNESTPSPIVSLEIIQAESTRQSCIACLYARPPACGKPAISPLYIGSTSGQYPTQPIHACQRQPETYDDCCDEGPVIRQEVYEVSYLIPWIIQVRPAWQHSRELYPSRESQALENRQQAHMLAYESYFIHLRSAPSTRAVVPPILIIFTILGSPANDHGSMHA